MMKKRIISVFLVLCMMVSVHNVTIARGDGHVHQWRYDDTGSIIQAECDAEGCDIVILFLEIYSPTLRVEGGNGNSAATIVSTGGWNSENGLPDPDTLEIVYYDISNNTPGVQLDGPPDTAGAYEARVGFGGYSAYIQYSILPSYTVSYNPGSEATGTTVSRTIQTSPHTLQSLNDVMSGSDWAKNSGSTKEFVGWRVGSTVYQPGDQVNLTADTEVTAEWANLYTLTLTEGRYAAITAGEASQTVQEGNDIETVTYTAESGYSFPEESEVYGTAHGITVTRNSDIEITVSGSPDDTMTIVLPNADVRGVEPEPVPRPSPHTIPVIPFFEPMTEEAPETKTEPGEEDEKKEEEEQKDPAGEQKPTPKPKAKVYKSKVKLSWDKVEGATKYRIVQIVGGKSKVIAEQSDTSLNIKKAYKTVRKKGKKQLKLRKLTAGKSYTFAVSAFINGEWTEITKETKMKVKIPN